MARRWGACLLLTAVLLVTSCSTGIEPHADNTRQARSPQVGAIMYSRDLEFWRLAEAGMRTSARALHVPLHVDVSERQLQTESQLMDTMYARGDNVLLAAPYDSEASAASLRRARNRGMSIVQYDDRVEDSSFGYFVGVDQTALGATLGEATQQYLESTMDGGANVALLTGETESNGPPRRKSFLSRVPGARVLTSTEATGSPQEGAEALQTILQSHPDVQVVWAWNGAALQGAATEARRLGSPVKIVGIDMSRRVADLLSARDSPVVAVADQNAYEIGSATLRAGVGLARGQPVRARQYIAPIVYHAGDTAALSRFYHELDAR